MHHFILAKVFEIPKDFFTKSLLVRVWGRSPHLSFGERCAKELLHRIYHFILAKAFEDSQETFPEKFLVSGFGAEATTFNAHTKSTAIPCFFIYQNMSELRSKPCFKGLFVKSPLKIRKNFPTFSHFIHAKISKLLLHGNILYIKFDIFYFCRVNAAELYQHIP